MREAIQNLAGGNKIAFLLISIILLNLSYPFSETGTIAALLFVGLYLVLTGSSIYLVSSDHRLLILAVLLAIAHENDLERFLSMIRFESKEKLKGLPDFRFDS